MKYFRILLIFTVLAISTACSAQNSSIFKPLASEKGIDRVYVGPALMKTVGKAAIKDAGDDFPDGLIESLTSIEVISADSSSSAAKAMAFWEKEKEKLNLSVILEANEDNEEVVIYANLSENSDTFTQMIVVTNEPGETNLINFTGKFNVAALGELNGD